MTWSIQLPHAHRRKTLKELNFSMECEIFVIDAFNVVVWNVVVIDV